MLTVKPCSTIKMEKDEEIQYTIDVTDELGSNTIAALDFNITDSDMLPVDSDFNGGITHDGAGIISFGVKAFDEGKYKLEFIVTCNETLPNGSTPYEFIFYMWIKVKDV